MPKVFGKAEMNQRKLERGEPVGSKLPPRFPPPANVQHRPDCGAVKKSKHRVVEFMVPDTDMIHIMRQAGN